MKNPIRTVTLLLALAIAGCGQSALVVQSAPPDAAHAGDLASSSDAGGSVDLAEAPDFNRCYCAPGTIDAPPQCRLEFYVDVYVSCPGGTIACCQICG